MENINNFKTDGFENLDDRRDENQSKYKNKKHDNDYFAYQENELISHEITPKDRLQNQIRLATDIYQEEFGQIDVNELTTEKRNEIMGFWGEKDFSRLYRELEESDNFRLHPRLQGDIFKITAEDIICYKENGELPK